MKKIITAEELSETVQKSVTGGMDSGTCDCGTVKCTCACDDRRDAPKVRTAREFHKTEQAAVKARTERNNL